MSQETIEIPYVGQAATLTIGADHYPATVIWVSPSGTKMRLQYDQHHGRGISTPNPNGEIVNAYWSKQNRWQMSKKSYFFITLGERNYARDRSF